MRPNAIEPTAPSGERHFGAKSEMQLAEEATGQFRYLLNAMEFAAQSGEPARAGYYDKRLAVMQHVASLSTERARMERERAEAVNMASEYEAGRNAADRLADAAEREVSRLTSELDRVRGALEFYATIANWYTPSTGFAAQYDPDPSPIYRDGGHKARTALGVTPDATTRREG